MNLEKMKSQKPDPTEMAQELLANVNGLWRELTMKSKPRKDFVDHELTKLTQITGELRQYFFKGEGSANDEVV